MEIRCQKCHKIHSIPDEAADNKRVFFYCNNCGRKIVIDNRQSIEKTHSVPTSPLSFKDILNAVRLIFSSTTFILTLIYTLTAIIICSALGGLLVKQFAFFAQHMHVTIMLSITVAIILLYGHSMLLYLVSKINFYKLEVQGEESVDWKSIMFDFKEDAITVFFFSIGVVLFFVLLLIPVLFLGPYSVLYAGITLPLSLSLAILLVLSCILHTLIPTIIASKSLFVIDAIREVFSFIKRELLHIPFYLVTIEIISMVVYTLISSIVMIALFLTGSGIFFFLDSNVKKQLMNLVLSLRTVFIEKSAHASEIVTPPVSIGIILFAIVGFVIVLFLGALYINIKQAFYTQACHIMQKNPSRSINRSSMMLALFVLFFAGVVVLGIAVYSLL